MDRGAWWATVHGITKTLGGCLPAGKTEVSLETWNFQPHLPILLSIKG